MIAVGLEHTALIIGVNNKVYRWRETDFTEDGWESWPQEPTWYVTTSLNARLYKIDFKTRKIL
jgi:hypothetical protein